MTFNISSVGKDTSHRQIPVKISPHLASFFISTLKSPIWSTVVAKQTKTEELLKIKAGKRKIGFCNEKYRRN